MKKILCFALLVVLTGCVCKAPTGDYCLITRTITYSGTWDTPDTVNQIRQHNAVYQELCGGFSARRKEDD